MRGMSILSVSRNLLLALSSVYSTFWYPRPYTSRYCNLARKRERPTRYCVPRGRVWNTKWGFSWSQKGRWMSVTKLSCGDCSFSSRWMWIGKINPVCYGVLVVGYYWAENGNSYAEELHKSAASAVVIYLNLNLNLPISHLVIFARSCFTFEPLDLTIGNISLPTDLTKIAFNCQVPQNIYIYTLWCKL